MHKNILYFFRRINRIIESENLLIDATFVYPKTFSETIIIMYYDPSLYKMIQGIFIDILSYVKNDKKN